MSINTVLAWFGDFIYAAMAVSAMFGVYQVILLIRRIGKKGFSGDADAEYFREQIGDHFKKRDFDGALELCDSPEYWAKAVPQLTSIAINNRTRSPTKLRKLVGEKFAREILSDLEYGTSWVATVVKSAPMMGLLGTVVGMILAFAQIKKMSAEGTGIAPGALAGDISFALFTTAAGLLIALPLVLAGNWVHVKIGKMQDQVQENMNYVLEDLDEAMEG